MKVIKNNYNRESIQYICEECNSIFEYNDDDIFMDNNGVEYVRCPCCKNHCYINEEIPTVDNIEFPKHFHKIGENAIKISDKEINKYIKKCINWLEKNPNEPLSYIGTGDSFIVVFNHENEYYILVAKNYFDSYIDK